MRTRHILWYGTPMQGHGLKVYVGMSGGVDSSVSAALLKEAGYQVTGVFIKTWYPDFLECSWRDERDDALRVAATLGIPFETLDLEDAYRTEVAEYMIREYTLGRTPNPDVMCNKHVKFGAFYEYARKQGADRIATGHYARIQEMREDVSSHEPRIPYPASHRLLAGVDTNKDQSYFLWTLSQDVLAHTLFPIGDRTKADVREEARKRSLPVADKKDSQGVCFLGDVDMKEFIRRSVTVTPGDVITVSGDVIGKHDGAILYTLGERRGFEVTKKSPTDGPWYVVAKDISKNTLTVSQRENIDAEITSVVLEQVNWISGEAPSADRAYACRFRYRQPLRPCRLESVAGVFEVFFDTPQEFVVPGQSLVIYDGDELVGGGVIASTKKL